MQQPTAAKPRLSFIRDSGWLAPLAVLAAGAVLVEMLAAVFVTVTITQGNPVGDWVSFYTAATIVHSGDGAHLFDAATQAATQEAIFSRDLAENGYPLAAFFACAVSPLAALSFVQSYWVWFAVNLCALAGLALVARSILRDAGPAVRNALLAGALFSTPMVYALVLGQVDVFVLLSMLGAWSMMKREQPVAAGCLLAIAAVKPHLVAALVLMLIVKREWRALGGFAAVAVPLFAFPVIALGPGIVADQARLVLAYPGSSTDHQVAAAMMVNVRGAIVSVVPGAQPWLWLPPLALIGGVAIALAVRVWRTEGVSAPRSWAIALILPLLYSPHAHIQNMLLLVGAAVLFAAAQDPRRPVLRPEHALAAVVVFVAFWLLSVAAVSLSFVLSLFAIYMALRHWPEGGEAGAVELPDTECSGEGAARAA
jgi:hypothetical protein